MTVAEVIALLAKFDPAMTVVMPNDIDYGEVAGAFEDLVCFDGQNAQLADATDAGVVKVVRLHAPNEWKWAAKGLRRVTKG